MKKSLSPKIEIFNPFIVPFRSKKSGFNKAVVNGGSAFSMIVDPEVTRYMKSGNKRLEIVAKCTPCQCCACR